jgi:acyl transferase domain-containing protein/thioesterase domain-containing protein
MDSLNSEATMDGVAIIGMSGRFPGADNVDHLWQNLCDGKESITFFKTGELDPSIPADLKNDPHYVKARGLFEHIDRFDAKFFGISPQEARFMDPQQRIFLEVSWEAFENSGYQPESCKGLIGVFAGCGLNSYYSHHVMTNPPQAESISRHLIELCNSPDYLATRVSFKLNLKGPSISLFTGCSTSLVAVSHGFDSLMNFQCDMAIAGGVYISCPPQSGYLYQEGEMLSKEGHIRPFDTAADGTVFSSGAGAVVMKRLEDALEDNDTIYAVIRGTAVNNDGHDKISFTAPSVNGQAEVIAMAHANAGISADTISYIETHGTGTPLGDPIEIEALTQAFASTTRKRNFCAIGSIKANIGHLDAAAGVVGLMKTALALYYKKIPPLINFTAPNPQIDFDKTPFRINTQLYDWISGDHPRRAGISSFGVGGTNSHVVLEEACFPEKKRSSRRWQLLNLSARSDEALSHATTNLCDFLESHPQVELENIAYTLQTGRKDFLSRRIAVCRDNQDAIAVLNDADSRRNLFSKQNPANRDIAFMFSGQGAQYPNMGRELYQNEAVFRECIDQCSQILEQYLSFDLHEILYPSPASAEKANEKLSQTVVTQPALFVLEYALAKLWLSWGIQPSVFVGHSIGEYVAACLSGVFSLADALFLVATRGKLIQNLPKGSMLAVFASPKDISAILSDHGISLAAINAPSLCVISGKPPAIEAAKIHLQSLEISYTSLLVSHAFHSAMMDPILNSFEKQMKQIELHPPEIQIFSNVTGKPMKAEEATNPSYWVTHLRETVQFSECIQNLMLTPNRILLEIGPGNSLCTLAKQHFNDANSLITLSSIRHPKETISDEAFMLRTLGKLWLNEVAVDWTKLYANPFPKRVALPTYPFERQRFWLESKQDATIIQRSAVSQENIHHKQHSDDDLNESSDQKLETDSLNEVENTLLNIMKKVLGFNHIGIHDDYFDLGGSSLMAIQIFNRIEKKFGLRLPLATLYEAPTIKKLAEIVRQKDYQPLWSALVPIKPEGSRPPFFCIHGAGGNVLLYRGLARHLHPDQPFYGIQCVGMDGEESYLTRIEDMAARYIDEIGKHQPKGPYYLGGYCMGGQVAFEMARQLEQKGRKVAFLALFDSHRRYIEEKRIHYKTLKFLQNIGFHIRNIFLLNGFDHRYAFVKERTLEARRRIHLRRNVLLQKLSNQLGLSNDPPLLIMEKINDRACWDYIAKPYGGTVTVFKPLSAYIGYQDNDLGWGNVCEKVDVQQLPVFPAGMLVEPFDQILSEKFQSCLEAAQKKYKNISS